MQVVVAEETLEQQIMAAKAAAEMEADHRDRLLMVLIIQVAAAAVLFKAMGPLVEMVVQE
jgi:hypothetical protein